MDDEHFGARGEGVGAAGAVGVARAGPALLDGRGVGALFTAGPPRTDEDVVERHVCVELVEGAHAVVRAERVLPRWWCWLEGGLRCWCDGHDGLQQFAERVRQAGVLDDMAGPGSVCFTVQGAREAEHTGQVAHAGAVGVSEAFR